jgi:hypothetical protein
MDKKLNFKLRFSLDFTDGSIVFKKWIYVTGPKFFSSNDRNSLAFVRGQLFSADQ